MRLREFAAFGAFVVAWLLAHPRSSTGRANLKGQLTVVRPKRAEGDG
jgi:hypothetical protein